MHFNAQLFSVPYKLLLQFCCLLLKNVLNKMDYDWLTVFKLLLVKEKTHAHEKVLSKHLNQSQFLG